MDAVKLFADLDQQQLRDRLCRLEEERAALSVLLRAVVRRDRQRSRQQSAMQPRQKHKAQEASRGE
jgi:hypothetical protein